MIQEYLDMGHAEPVPTTSPPLPAGSTYYLPMHSVVKETSSTTKLMVVFDASAKTTSGASLNDCLMVGPTLFPFVAVKALQQTAHDFGDLFPLAKPRVFSSFYVDDCLAGAWEIAYSVVELSTLAFSRSYSATPSTYVLPSTRHIGTKGQCVCSCSNL